MSRPRRSHERSQRGATLVEYVLFVGGFALVATTAVGGLNNVARTYFRQNGTKIGQPVNRLAYDENGNRPTLASTTSITAPPSTTSTTTKPTTTLPPTTTAPPTTTTLPPPTTTTTPPTTTTTSGQQVSTTLTDQSTNGTGGTWNFKVRIKVTGIGGAKVDKLTVSGDGKVGGFVAASFSCVTDKKGECTVGYDSVPDAYSPVVFEVTDVGGAAPWTGATKSITVYAR